MNHELRAMFFDEFCVAGGVFCEVLVGEQFKGFVGEIVLVHVISKFFSFVWASCCAKNTKVS